LLRLHFLKWFQQYIEEATGAYKLIIQLGAILLCIIWTNMFLYLACMLWVTVCDLCSTWQKVASGKFYLVLCSRWIHKRLVSWTTSQDGATAKITSTQTIHFNLQLLFQSIFNLVNNSKNQRGPESEMKRCAKAATLWDGIWDESPSKPSIYECCKHFCETGCLSKWEAPSAAKCMDGSWIPTWCVHSYKQCTYRTPLSDKILCQL
jgi:hypothetical protein